MSPSGEGFDSLRVVITGASSGIGRAAAEKLVSRGARVAIWARRKNELEALASELGEAAVAVACDVSDPVAVAQATEESEQRLGGIVNGLICAAGVADPLPLAQLDAAAWSRTIDANLSGTFYPCKAIGQRLRDEDAEGSIVNVGSELSSFGAPYYSAYCASKYGVIGLTKALAAELAPKVRVNVLCPGPVDTPMLAGEFQQFTDLGIADGPEEARKGENQRPPMKRIGNPEEMAAAAVWLLVDATFATGSLVPIDGGTTAT